MAKTMTSGILAAALCLSAAITFGAPDKTGDEDKKPLRDPQRRESERRRAPESVKLAEGNLAAHWTFDGDSLDQSGNGNHGRSYHVDFSGNGRGGRPNTAALFNGIDSCIEVSHSPALSFGDGDFTIAAWIRLNEAVESQVGDILSKYDSQRRRGINFYVKGSSAGYNSIGDTKSLFFGIDNGMESAWEDCGRPWPGNTCVNTLTVYNGALYAGLAGAPDPKDACHVFRYAGGQKWEDCGRVAPSLNTPSVFSMAVHQGDLYCGTGTTNWEVVKPGKSDFVRVYRYAGGKKWIDCGAPCETYRIHALASFKGELYAQTDDLRPTPGKSHLYRYLGGTQWEPCGNASSHELALSLMAHHGHLYAGMGDPGEILRYEGGSEWTYLGHPGRNVQAHTLGVHRGKLYAGTWPDGYVFRYDGGMDWTNCGALGLSADAIPGYRDAINEINDLTVHNGKLYAGAIPIGEVYRYEDGASWTMMRRLVSDPAFHPDSLPTWARVWSLTEFGGRLYAGTSSCRGEAQKNPHGEYGRVYSFMAGQCVSYDYDLGAGWRHVAAVRRGGSIQLFVDGRRVSISQSFSSPAYDLSNNEPLYIGFGALDYFSGAIDDMQIYRRALSEEELAGFCAGTAIPPTSDSAN